MLGGCSVGVFGSFRHVSSIRHMTFMPFYLFMLQGMSEMLVRILEEISHDRPTSISAIGQFPAGA